MSNCPTWIWLRRPTAVAFRPLPQNRAREGPKSGWSVRWAVTGIAARARTCHDRCVEAVLWIVLAIALAIAEAFTATLLVIMFAAGALAAAGAAALGAPVLLQAIVFALVSGLSVGAIRPIIMRSARSALEPGEAPIGMAALEGAHGLVLEEVDADRGMIKIDGELWQARSFDGTEKYLPGERVRVIKVRGATAIVWRDNLPNI
jgi:membrane protein implicated in regulation of membrane protease activity